MITVRSRSPHELSGVKIPPYSSLHTSTKRGLTEFPFLCPQQSVLILIAAYPYTIAAAAAAVAAVAAPTIDTSNYPKVSVTGDSTLEDSEKGFLLLLRGYDIVLQ